ncbi:MAG: 50S ribosomal protein L22P [ANME-2 cluster archaeon HR1]|jgi:large subunit ribosomal protein L22|nr:MAG: large subunit ribosomal protein L22 [ANME-2 cluster archaeon]KAF5427740.1 large subunit ribosomal protein L22 [ANME-2 cluster archaeon]PPA80051.1 MAG: 50S ribosomal protein L22P [ANME-2 cluster archaeon HR1]
MSRIQYSVQTDPETTSKAIGHELHISPRHSREICRAIKGMRTGHAKKYLDNVVALKQAVPFKRHNDSMGHRKGPMAAGRYPQKAAKEFIKILINAQANAEYKGIEPEDMKIAHVATKKGRVIRGYRARARGSSSPKNTETVNIEMILEEVQ